MQQEAPDTWTQEAQAFYSQNPWQAKLHLLLKGIAQFRLIFNMAPRRRIT